MTLGVKQVVDTTAPGTFRSVIEILRLAAAASADSQTAEDVQKSFKQLLSKLKFQVTDDASQMRPVCAKINELINLIGIDGSMIFLHCNAHIVPALDAGVTKVLIDVETFLQISDQMVRSFNQSFQVSNSNIETMLRAIFKFVGDSVKNDSWAMTNEKMDKRISLKTLTVQDLVFPKKCVLFFCIVLAMLRSLLIEFYLCC